MDPLNPPNLNLPTMRELEKETLRRMRLPSPTLSSIFPSLLHYPSEGEEEEEDEDLEEPEEPEED